MLTQAGSGACTETCQSERVQVITLAFPSFRPELLRILVILLTIMCPSVLERHKRSLFYRQIFDKIIFDRDSLKESCCRPIESGDLTLEVIDIDHLLQVLMSNIIVGVDQ